MMFARLPTYPGLQPLGTPPRPQEVLSKYLWHYVDDAEVLAGLAVTGALSRVSLVGKSLQVSSTLSLTLR